MLVFRAVLNGWDTPQHVRDAITDQLVPAMHSYLASETAPTASAHHRAIKHVVKCAQLALRMDATCMILDGHPKGRFPYLRRRYPEKRKPRRGHVKRQEEAQRRLFEKLWRRSKNRSVGHED